MGVKNLQFELIYGATNHICWYPWLLVCRFSFKFNILDSMAIFIPEVRPAIVVISIGFVTPVKLYLLFHLIIPMHQQYCGTIQSWDDIVYCSASSLNISSRPNYSSGVFIWFYASAWMSSNCTCLNSIECQVFSY